MITLTKEQEKVVDFKGQQMLVKGIAGSGKTLVLLKHAEKTAIENPNAKIGIFSYGKTLTQAASTQVNHKNISVQTFHKWAAKVYKNIYGIPSYCNSTDEKKFFEKALHKISKSYNNHRFFKNEGLKEFIRDEITWIKGCGFELKEDYLNASRKGRGTKIRLSQLDRTILFDIYFEYENNKFDKLDYDDSARAIAKRLDSIPDYLKFDYIYIDEAQDLSKMALCCLVSAGKKGCYIGADIGQKIYTTSFTWKEVGLDLRGNRVRTLNQSFRSTKEIVELAQSLQRNDEITQDEEFTEHIIPKRSGKKPDLVYTNNVQTQDDIIRKIVTQLTTNYKDKTIGILCRNYDSINRISKLVYGEVLGKNNTSPTTKGVKLTTYYTSKGLEFDFVIIPDILNPSSEALLGEEFDWNKERRLLYVAMTRAKLHLQLFTTDLNAKLITELTPELYNLKKI